jgi:hypothetical protein
MQMSWLKAWVPGFAGMTEIMKAFAAMTDWRLLKK